MKKSGPSDANNNEINHAKAINPPLVSQPTFAMVPSSSSSSDDTSNDAQPDTYNLTGSKNNVFYCGICDCGCNSRSTLSYHMNTHTGAKPFECDQSKKRFANPNALAKHRKTLFLPRNLNALFVTKCFLH